MRRISIHAPLRGRLPTFLHASYASDFNPRPLAGATSFYWHWCAVLRYFNPRPLAGATSVTLRFAVLPVFQSTPPGGGDCTENFKRKVPHISIHAPLRGRRFSCVSHSSAVLFQSTPPCGGDAGNECMIFKCNKFQSTPPCGGDKSFTPGH